MTACIWIQYEPAGSTTPYAGFINSTVTGDDQKPPVIGLPRLQFSVSIDTIIDGMQVDTSQQQPSLISILPENIPALQPAVTIDQLMAVLVDKGILSTADITTATNITSQQVSSTLGSAITVSPNLIG